MTELNVVNKLYDLGCELIADGDALRIQAPKGSLPSTLIRDARKVKPQLIAFVNMSVDDWILRLRGEPTKEALIASMTICRKIRAWSEVDLWRIGVLGFNKRHTELMAKEAK